jgi:hypothetical protein
MNPTKQQGNRKRLSTKAFQDIVEDNIEENNKIVCDKGNQWIRQRLRIELCDKKSPAFYLHTSLGNGAKLRPLL